MGRRAYCDSLCELLTHSSWALATYNSDLLHEECLDTAVGEIQGLPIVMLLPGIFLSSMARGFTLQQSIPLLVHRCWLSWIASQESLS